STVCIPRLALCPVYLSCSRVVIKFHKQNIRIAISVRLQHQIRQIVVQLDHQVDGCIALQPNKVSTFHSRFHSAIHTHNKLTASAQQLVGCEIFNVPPIGKVEIMAVLVHMTGEHL